MIRIDTVNNQLWVEEDGKERSMSLSSPEAFKILSKIWLRCGFENKYAYEFSWLGRPVIQIPEDLIRVQEVIFQVKPDVIVETGIAHGGGIIFYSSLCKLMGKGRVLGVDVEIRPHNREALAGHFLRDWFRIFEGDSLNPDTVGWVRSQIQPENRVMVILDSKHTRDHVLGEMEAYSPLVSPGSYLVVADGIMRDLAGSRRAGKDWEWNHPLAAVEVFLQKNPQFRQEEPVRPFSEGFSGIRVTYWPGGFLKRVQ